MMAARAEKPGSTLTAAAAGRRWTCRATGCPCRPSPGALFCGQHWLAIPKALRDQLSDNAGQRGSTRDPLVIETLNRAAGQLVAQAIDAIDRAQPRGRQEAAEHDRPTMWWQE